MRKNFDLSRFFVLPWVTVIALLLPNLTVNNAFASATPTIKKQLDIAVGQTVNFNFSMKKDEQIAISITGLSQETASGFRGDCGVFTSAGKSTFRSHSFRNDYVSTHVYDLGTGGDYFLNCTNLSTKEDAKIVITAVSFESITNPNNGNIIIPGMESALVSFKVKKDIPWFLTILGSGKTTASGFRGDCTAFDSSGQNTYAGLAFTNDFGSSTNSLPTYSGEVVLFCTNYSREKAVLTFGIYSTAALRSETISTISIAPIDFAVLRFTAQKSQPISISTKGNPKKTTSGFYGDCSIYDENGRFSYDLFNFSADQVIAKVITPSYSGFYYLLCKNRGNEAAIFEVFGLTELKQITMTSDFLIAGDGSTTTKASSSPKPSISSTPTPSATATNPQSGSGQSPGASSGARSGNNSQVQTSVDQATRLASVANDAAINLNTNAFNEKAYKDALDTINKAIASANNAVEKAKDAAKNAKDSAKDAAESQVKAAEKALEAAKSAKQAASEAKSINSTISGIRDASKNTNVSQPKSSSKGCEVTLAIIGGALGIAGAGVTVVSGGLALPLVLAAGAAATSVAGAAKC